MSPTFQQPWTMQMFNYLGRPLGAINDAHERVFTFQFNAPQTIQFTLDTTNVATKRFIEEREKAVFVTLYYYGELCMTTEVTNLNLIGSPEGRSLAVTCTETMWTRLMPRLVGIGSVTGYNSGGATDKFTIVRAIVNAINAEGSEKDSSGIVPLSVVTLGTSAEKLTALYTPFQEVLEQLAFTGTGGFDFWQNSTMNTSPDLEYSRGTTGVLEFAELKGKDRSNTGALPASEQAIFEYGFGTKANVASYSWTSDYTLLANSVTVLPTGYPEQNSGVPTTLSVTASQKDFGYRQALAPITLTSAALASELALAEVTIRSVPRQLLLFTPVPHGAGTAPEFKPSPNAKGRFETGDFLTARIKDNGIILNNAKVRCYGSTIVLDDNGGQTETLALSMNPS